MRQRLQGRFLDGQSRVRDIRGNLFTAGKERKEPSHLYYIGPLLHIPFAAWHEWRSLWQGRRLAELEARLAIDRTFSLMREFYFCYGTLVSRGINQPLFPTRKQILNQIRELYLEVMRLRQQRGDFSHTYISVICHNQTE
jgi:hypothetical protein